MNRVPGHVRAAARGAQDAADERVVENLPRLHVAVVLRDAFAVVEGLQRRSGDAAQQLLSALLQGGGGDAQQAFRRLAVRQPPDRLLRGLVRGDSAPAGAGSFSHEGKGTKSLPKPAVLESLFRR